MRILGHMQGNIFLWVAIDVIAGHVDSDTDKQPEDTNRRSLS